MTINSFPMISYGKISSSAVTQNGTQRGTQRMNYLINRQGRYYFNRRVPTEIGEYDSRPLIRIALKTDCKKIAVKLAMSHNDQLEAYWKELIASESKHSEDQYSSAVKRASLMGFTYASSQTVATLPTTQIIERLNYLNQTNINQRTVEAVLGGVEPPVVKLDKALSLFWDYAKPNILNKSPNQIRKWKNPRNKAIQNLINCIGNKPIHEVTREDMLKFRDWWISRLEKEDMVCDSANKDLINAKIIIETVCENLKIDLDTSHIFKKLLLKSEEEGKRLPFTTDFITATLLNPKNLTGLNDEAKWVLHAFAETGAGFSELLGLLPEEINLDHEIPHIAITPRKGHALKKKYRKRVIPLVGYALDAFKACPDGFTRYRGNPDSLSTLLNAHFRECNIMPSQDHSIYSLRHSFQDRLLAVNAPDRIQAELMGHKFHRPSYGEGGSLEQKLEFMKKIQVKN